MSDLPAASVLIEAARAAMRDVRPVPGDPDETRAKRHRAASRVLARYAPAIDELRDIRGIAAFLGLASQHSLRRNKWRTRADGTPAWPDPDETYGGTDTWRLRTIVIHRAGSPGQGHPGMPGRRASRRATSTQEVRHEAHDQDQ